MPISKYFQRFNLRMVAAALAMVISAMSAPSSAEPLHGNQHAAIAEDSYEKQSLRLQAIGYRLARSNAAQCDNREMITGLLLHNIGGYGQADRSAVMEAYNLTYGFGVLSVVPESGADAAGLADGDEIISINGGDLAGFARDFIRAGATYDRTEKFVVYLGETLRLGPATLGVRRGAGQVAVRLSGTQGCGSRFAMLHRRSINAWSDGRYVAVTDRMMSYVLDDQELAFVVAHEMAHNILRHAEQTKGMSPLLVQFGFGAGKLKASEIEADRLAIVLMARAGYDLGAPERLLMRTSKARWMDLPITHPGISRRIRIVRAAVEQLPRSLLSDGKGEPYIEPGATAWTDTKVCRSGTDPPTNCHSPALENCSITNCRGDVFGGWECGRSPIFTAEFRSTG